MVLSHTRESFAYLDSDSVVAKHDIKDLVASVIGEASFASCRPVALLAAGGWLSRGPARDCSRSPSEQVIVRTMVQTMEEGGCVWRIGAGGIPSMLVRKAVSKAARPHAGGR